MRLPRPEHGAVAAFGGWAALLVVYVVWGSTYLAIRVRVETIPPLLLAGIRYLIAGLILFPFAIRGGSPETRTRTAPQGELAGLCRRRYPAAARRQRPGVRRRAHVPSGFASLLVATVPLWLLVLDAVLDRRWLGWLPCAA